MFGPEGFGGMTGKDGKITGMGDSTVAIIARWSIRREGSARDGSPILRFRAWFSWRNDVLMKFCQNGTMKGRVRVYMHSTEKGDEQIDIVDWDEWKVDADGALTLSNIRHFETAPMRA